MGAQIGIDQARKNILAGITTAAPTAPVRHDAQLLGNLFLNRINKNHIKFNKTFGSKIEKKISLIFKA